MEEFKVKDVVETTFIKAGMHGTKEWQYIVDSVNENGVARGHLVPGQDSGTAFPFAIQEPNQAHLGRPERYTLIKRKGMKDERIKELTEENKRLVRDLERIRDGNMQRAKRESEAHHQKAMALLEAGYLDVHYLQTMMPRDGVSRSAGYNVRERYEFAFEMLNGLSGEYGKAAMKALTS